MQTLPFAALMLLVSALPAAAQAWPTKPVRIVVPFGAGSTPDIIMRLIGDRLQAKSKQTVVIENKAGASGNLGTDAVAKAPSPTAPPSASAFSGPSALNTLLFAKMPYDPFKDLALVTRLTDQPSILAVNAGGTRPEHHRADRAAQARAGQI